jgi:hypothetical protein
MLGKNVKITYFRGRVHSPFRIWASEETGSWADKKRAETSLAYAACPPASRQGKADKGREGEKEREERIGKLKAREIETRAPPFSCAREVVLIKMTQIEEKNENSYH